METGSVDHGPQVEMFVSAVAELKDLLEEHEGQSSILVDFANNPGHPFSLDLGEAREVLSRWDTDQRTEEDEDYIDRLDQGGSLIVVENKEEYMASLKETQVDDDTEIETEE